MDNKYRPLRPADYQEPICLLNVGPDRNIQSIPQRRVAEKMDEYMQKRDYSAAERHLQYWLEEAKAGHDQQGQLMVCNEMIGFYRKMNVREKAYAAIDEAFLLLRSLGFVDNIYRPKRLRG